MVEFYESDEVLATSVAGFLAAGLQAGLPVVVIATPVHSSLFAALLGGEHGQEVEGLQQRGLLTWLDARTLLTSLMDGPLPDAARFRAQLQPVLERAQRASARGNVCAYGEMVDLLWRDGNTEGALRLEALWNELARTHSFSLLCAYSMGGLYAEQHGAFFPEVCCRHERVIAPQSFWRGGEQAAQRERQHQLAEAQRVAVPASAPATLAARSPLHEAPGATSAQVAPRRMVLVVDDEPAVRRLLVRVLGRQGYGVLEAGGGQEALALLQERAHEVDLVLLDLTMPVLDGLATLEVLADRHPGLPVVLMSGYMEEPQDGQQGHSRAVAGFLAKPFALAEVTSVVVNTLAQRA